MKFSEYSDPTINSDRVSWCLLRYLWMGDDHLRSLAIHASVDHGTYSNYMSHMGVSRNGGTPKWMVYFMDNPSTNGWFRGIPISGNLHMDIGWKLEQRHVGLRGLASDLSHPTGPILRYQILTYPHSQNHQQTGLWPQSFWHVQHQLRIHSVWGQN